ncbi:MAG: hypothetical protein KKD11_06290, partial [Candidatus Omnitrophica bacterium]|nr:hypothetical protein [Candidatus Omnitrophota bacterium]
MIKKIVIYLFIGLLVLPGSIFAYEVRSLKDSDDAEKHSIVDVPEIREKLETLITVDFRDVSLDYVLDFLSEATGVNIISGQSVESEDKKVTIKVKDMTLDSVLKYILRNQGLLYRIEQNAVWVDTFDAIEEETLETRIYYLDQGLAMFTEFSGNTASSTGEGFGGASSISNVSTIKDVLEDAVVWPSDSKINVDERTGALIVTNSPSNLKIIEDILYNLDIDATQILIETRFIEINVTDFSELGINLSLDSPFAIYKDAGVPVNQISSGSGSKFSAFTGASEGLNLTYQGMLTKPQFSAVLHALERTTKLKTLSAPKITTLNNQTATIEIVNEFVYPTRYEPTLIKEDLNNDGDFLDEELVSGVLTKETRFVNVAQGFETRDVGILLQVTPNVGSNKETITLTLRPEV